MIPALSAAMSPNRGPGFLFALVLAAAALSSLAACSTGPKLPVPTPPAHPVYIPVPVPCEIEQIEPSPLPSDKGFAADIYEAVKVLLADREVLLGDRKKLIAANRTPCPGGTE